MMNVDSVQHINLKVFIEKPESIHLEDAVPVFHQWIRDRACPETLIDVADYRHVPEGPGIMLIAHEAFYSIDCRENKLGLLYNRRTALEGTLQERLDQAYSAALAAGHRLESESVFKGKLKFDWNHLEVSVNDRLLAPNTEETWQALRPELEKFFPDCKIERRGERRDLFRVSVTKN